MRRARRVIAGGSALAALCGCGSASGPGSSASPNRDAGIAGIALGSPARHVAATDQLVFSPAALTVHVGDVVQWSNTGTVPHTVTFETQPHLTDPADLAPGSRWEVKVTVPGTYFYYCSIHAGMAGKLVVTEP